MLGDLAYRIGAAAGRLEGQLRSDGPLGGDGGDRSPGGGSIPGGDRSAGGERTAGAGPNVPGDGARLDEVVLTSAGAWLVSRLLRPRPVRWSRVVVAGVVGSLAADVMGRAGSDAEPAAEDAIEGPTARRAPSPPYAIDPGELATRLGAGIALAAGYAAIVYPRLPGPPLLRGLAFGALEILAAPRGGLVHLATSTPGVKFPLRALAAPIDEDAGPVAHLAFGLTLGLLYRDDED